MKNISTRYNITITISLNIKKYYYCTEEMLYSQILSNAYNVRVQIIMNTFYVSGWLKVLSPFYFSIIFKVIKIILKSIFFFFKEQKKILK